MRPPVQGEALVAAEVLRLPEGDDGRVSVLDDGRLRGLGIGGHHTGHGLALEGGEVVRAGLSRSPGDKKIGSASRFCKKHTSAKKAKSRMMRVKRLDYGHSNKFAFSIR